MSTQKIIDCGIVYTYCGENELRVGTNENIARNGFEIKDKKYSSLYIKGSIQGKNVVEIGTYAFYESYDLLDVYIEEPVAILRFREFDKLPNLIAFHFPKTIQMLEKWCLSDWHNGVTKGTMNIIFHGEVQLSNVVYDAIVNKERFNVFFCSMPKLDSSTPFFTSYDFLNIYAPFSGRISNTNIIKSSHHCLIGVENSSKMNVCNCIGLKHLVFISIFII